MFRSVPFLALALLLLSCAVSLAETRLVGGYNDGWSTYAVIKRNNAELRTDQIPSRFNEMLWKELSPEDRRALLKVYGWQLNRRADHFGSACTSEMADWINREQGWTAAAEALKARHAAKEFPILTPVFGPDAPPLEIPDFACVNLEVVDSPSYREALRLSEEITADYAVGKQVYTLLVNAKWDQVSIAVKTISGELIPIIVDNFITGFVTNGASKTSELLATANSFISNLKEFLEGRLTPGATPPTPAELIDKLEKFITDMEGTAETAVTLVTQKKERLRTLADQLKQADAAATSRKKEEAAALRSSLRGTAAEAPTAPAVLPAIVPENPDATQEEKDASIRAQAQAIYTNYLLERAKLVTDKNTKIGQVTSDFSGLLDPPILPQALKYLAGVSDSFQRPYFEITDRLAAVNGWVATDLPAAENSSTAAASALSGAGSRVRGTMDEVLPSIDALQRKALWLDGYSAYLGFQPSANLDFTGLRNFDSLIDVAASSEVTAADLAAEHTRAAVLASEVKSSLPSGVNKREEWMRSEQTRYDSLAFNFENSVSYVIAALRQLDSLHASGYFKRAAYPFVSYDGVDLYRYSVDVEGIISSINAATTAAAREAARVDAVKELQRLRAEEETLLQRLEIAQRSHLNDAWELNTFFSGVAHRFETAPSIQSIAAEFSTVTGKTMKSPYELYTALIPDITYYYLGSGSLAGWIRNRSNLQTDIGSAVNTVSGKTLEYFLLLDLYNLMETQKGSYLGMSTEEFNAFMTETTLKIGSDGSYLNAFEMSPFWGPEHPAWQLVMKTRDRQESLNSQYRYNYTPPPVAWAIRGSVKTASGVGIPEVSILLNGYLAASTATGNDGSFFFDFIGNGNFTLTPSAPGYQISPSPAQLTMQGSDLDVTFTAAETSDSGYSVSGRVAYADGSGAYGVPLLASPATGEARTVLTGADGAYSFTSLPAGGWRIRPFGGGAFTPEARSVTLPQSAAGISFTAPAAVPEAPREVRATAGNASATVSFSPPASEGGSPITGYTVTSSPAGGVDADAGSTATIHRITGLANGTPYTFTVTAVNSVGQGPASLPSAGVTPTDAACGSSHNGTFASAPTENLCSDGTPSAITGSGPWSWSCAGISQTAGCTAAIRTYTVTPSPGAGGSTYPGLPQTVNVNGEIVFYLLPFDGYTLSSATGCGGTLSENGAFTIKPVTADCTFYVTFSPVGSRVEGACGSAHGGSFLSPPASGLCSSGTPGELTGDGPWNWICAGSGGGGTAACSAELQQQQQNDTTPPAGSIVIAGGKTATNSTAVAIILEATDDSGTVAGMSFSTDGKSWSDWEEYATQKVATLSTGDGMKRIYVRFRDPSGNISATSFAQVKLDTRAPSLSVKPLPAALRGETVNLIGTMEKGALVSVTANPAAQAGEVIYNIRRTGWSCSVGSLSEGEVVFTVTAIDAAGNSSTRTVSTRYDTTPPACGISLNGNGYYRKSAIPLLTGATDAVSGVSRMSFSNDGVVWSGWGAYAETRKWSVKKPDGEKTVYARFRDAAGNVSDPCTIALILDTVRPELTVNLPAPPVTGTEATFTGSGEEGADLRVRRAGGTEAETVAIDGTAWSYTATGLVKGTNSFIFSATDRAGNVTTRKVSIVVK